VPRIAELVDDQQLASGKLRLKPQEPFLVACLQKLVHERDGRHEADGEASLAGGKPESESHMALAGAAAAERDNVLAAQDGRITSLISSRRISLPRNGSRVGLRIVLFEACSAFTRVAACA
jgi:hypothetical protein